MLDLSNEQEQKEFSNNGPVPANSIVMVNVEVLHPREDRQSSDNPYIAVAKSGLRQIYCQFTVHHGTYQGVSFRQNITLPLGAQKVQLSKNQETACNIGGSILKAMCVAARKPPKMQDVTSLTGLAFPVKVKINQTPVEKDDGRIFWNNEIAAVVTPDKEQYAQVYNGGESITDGPVTGGGQAAKRQNAAPEAETWGEPYPGGWSDDVPF